MTEKSIVVIISKATSPFDDGICDFGYLRVILQGAEIVGEKGGVILGSATFFRAGALLSAQIYKICTLLSTGIVENVLDHVRSTAREALPDAAFRAVPSESRQVRR